MVDNQFAVRWSGQITAVEPESMRWRVAGIWQLTVDGQQLGGRLEQRRSLSDLKPVNPIRSQSKWPIGSAG